MKYIFLKFPYCNEILYSEKWRRLAYMPKLEPKNFEFKELLTWIIAKIFEIYTTTIYLTRVRRRHFLENPLVRQLTMYQADHCLHFHHYRTN